jgi:hypothetical protein
MLFGWSLALPLATLAWVTTYWPIAIVLVGAWLLVRDTLPGHLRGPIATVGGLALLAYGVLAAAATVASAGVGARPAFLPFGAPPIVDTVRLEAALPAGGRLEIGNSSGRTSVRVGAANTVRVVATRRYSDQPPEVQFTPADRGLRLGFTGGRGGFPFGRGASVDFEVEVPATVELSVRSSSGSVVVEGVTGPLELQTSSGDIQATGLERLRQAQSSSGDVELSGVFREDARIQTSSGSVEVRFHPDSSTRLDVRTSSGPIRVPGLFLSDTREERRSLSGTLGTGSGSLTIQTSSGGVTLRPL